ncbi:tripartite motif-containing protein 5-like isoform X1 [Saccopteryx bilineata]|uniref:tripartite motif-containing protein 5-like isoform X1 n=1 Tax=Saccopteryx bilineata TaxID=59482 RepID=UPI0033903EFF
MSAPQAETSEQVNQLFTVKDCAGICEQKEPQIKTDRSRRAAVMASGILVTIKEEVTCPICLELMTEPLSLDCGHSFCQTCITANNKDSVNGQEEGDSCPVCRIRYHPGSLRPNRNMANIVEMLREVKVSPEEEQKRDLCVRHGEKLLLFCKEDGKFICWLCERSQEHRDHHTFLMEEVAQEYKEKLRAALDKLRTEQQNAEKLGADIREEKTSWKHHIQSESQCVQKCFQKLRGILDNEEQIELQKLKKEEEEILCDLEEEESELAQQSQLVRDLISDLEHRLQGSTVELLQDVNGIMERSNTFTLKKPKPFKKKERIVFQVPDLRVVLEELNGLTDVRRYWVHMTLCRPINHQTVTISEDQREARHVSTMNTNYTYQTNDYNDYAVLGSPFVASGKHYWEVDVSRKSAWVLGVYCEEMPKLYPKESVVISSGNRPHIYSRYQPKYGYWVIGLENQCQYNAFENESNNCPWKRTLSLPVHPYCVGVFVDCEAGTVSFLNVTNQGNLIYKFSSCSFSQRLYPFFNLMTCAGPMTLCYPNTLSLKSFRAFLDLQIKKIFHKKH